MDREAQGSTSTGRLMLRQTDLTQTQINCGLFYFNSRINTCFAKIKLQLYQYAIRLPVFLAAIAAEESRSKSGHHISPACREDKSVGVPNRAVMEAHTGSILGFRTRRSQRTCVTLRQLYFREKSTG